MIPIKHKKDPAIIADIAACSRNHLAPDYNECTAIMEVTITVSKTVTVTNTFTIAITFTIIADTTIVINSIQT